MILLTVNGGSSSIKMALYDTESGLHRTADGAAGRISDPNAGVDALQHWLDRQPLLPSIAAVGHRLVHGMGRNAPERITPEFLTDMHANIAYDPNHLPGQIALIEACRRRFPDCPQVACFDTVFHRTMPRVATLLPLPRRYEAKGVVRYGFHGLSYAYLMEELVRLGDPAATRGRVVLAHLGGGASMAAVRDGKSIDTTMGFSPAGGIPMATRSGDLDPGLAGFLALTEQMAPATFSDMVCERSGMLGVSETSGDMRELLALEGADPRATDAITLFCYHARKAVGALAAALGGVDTLVFTGGIGENAPAIRARICEGLAFLGIAVDPEQNARNAARISPGDARVAVRVIRTNEELMIARSVLEVLDPVRGTAA